MNMRAKQGHLDTGPEMITTMMALVEASMTDSSAAEVAKQLCLDELCEDLAIQLASLGFVTMPEA